MKYFFRSIVTGFLACHLLLTGFAQTRPQNPQQPATPPSNQQKPATDDDDVVQITTNLVQVDPVITDSKGKPVTDLRPDEVQIFEDGKPQ